MCYKFEKCGSEKPDGMNEVNSGKRKQKSDWCKAPKGRLFEHKGFSRQQKTGQNLYFLFYQFFNLKCSAGYLLKFIVLSI